MISMEELAFQIWITERDRATVEPPDLLRDKVWNHMIAIGRPSKSMREAFDAARTVKRLAREGAFEPDLPGEPDRGRSRLIFFNSTDGVLQ